MKALVTGIAGFAGRHLLAHLQASGDEVLGTVRTVEQGAVSPPRSEFGALRDGVEVPLLSWDLSDRAGIPAETQRQIEAFAPEAIYHLAALSVPDRCGDPSPNALAWQTNVMAVRDLFELARRLPSRPRVLLVSSSQVYAALSAEQARVAESAPLVPRRGYGRTKLAAEELARAFAASGGEVVVVRAFQHAGPGQREPMMLPQWCRQLFDASGGPIEIYTADAWIDLSDVRDMVRGYRLLAVGGKPGMAYNLGSGSAQRTGDLVEQLLALASQTGRPIRQLRPGVKHDPVADVARLRDSVFWQPDIPIARTLADTLSAWRAAAHFARKDDLNL